MDVHRRHETEMFNKVKPRFSERFILSLTKCKTCLVLDDELNVLSISKYMRNLKPLNVSKDNLNTDLSDDLKHLKEGLVDLQPIGSLIKVAKSSDQARCLLRCLDLLVSRSQYNTQKKVLLQQKSDEFVSITSGRGRGKSVC